MSDIIFTTEEQRAAYSDFSNGYLSSDDDHFHRVFGGSSEKYPPSAMLHVLNPLTKIHRRETDFPVERVTSEPLLFAKPTQKAIKLPTSSVSNSKPKVIFQTPPAVLLRFNLSKRPSNGTQDEKSHCVKGDKEPATILKLDQFIFDPAAAKEKAADPKPHVKDANQPDTLPKTAQPTATIHTLSPTIVDTAQRPLGPGQIIALDHFKGPK